MQLILRLTIQDNCLLAMKQKLAQLDVYVLVLIKLNMIIMFSITKQLWCYG